MQVALNWNLEVAGKIGVVSLFAGCGALELAMSRFKPQPSQILVRFGGNFFLSLVRFAIGLWCPQML